VSFLFNELLFRPIFNILVFLYDVIPGNDFGVAIIILTILIKLIFFPLTAKSLVAQRKLSELQPKVKELQEKYKNDRQKLGAETMALYKQHQINPLSGCFPILIQLPVLFALFKALNIVFEPESLDFVYGFISNPGAIKETSFYFLNLSVNNPTLAITAGVLQYFQIKVSNTNRPKQGDAVQDPTQKSLNQMTKQMLYFFPIMIIIIAWNFPTGLVLYWVVTTGLSIVEQKIINKKHFSN